MGKVSYRPRKGQNRGEDKKKAILEKGKVDRLQEEIATTEDESVEVTKLKVENMGGCQEEIQSTKVVGDLGNDYHIYIEDYVYTYLYQLAASDYTRESSAVLVGQSYSDSKEILIKGMIPIPMDKLKSDSEWIDMGVVDEIEEERKKYFKDQQIIGWMHMQPGYGTMLTMKEVREHQNIFEGDGTVCLLVDAINKIETLFVYEGDELKEQTGYCMYYERNEPMQQYMLEHPFNSGIKEEVKDSVVNQFREIGKIRKAEYVQRKNMSLTVMAVSIILIGMTAVIVRMNGQLAVPTTNIPLVSPSSITNNEYKNLSDLAAGKGNEAIDKEGKENLQSDTQQSNEQSDAIVSSKDVENIENEEVKNDNSEEQRVDKEEETIQDENQDQIRQDVIKQDSEENYDMYIVEAGDTLADICYKQYGSAERSAEVAKYNGMENTDELYVGEKLKMPK